MIREEVKCHNESGNYFHQQEPKSPTPYSQVDRIRDKKEISRQYSNLDKYSDPQVNIKAPNVKYRIINDLLDKLINSCNSLEKM